MKFFISFFFVGLIFVFGNEEFDDEYITPNKQVFDPLYSYNKTMTDFNDFVYSNIFIPTAKGYAKVFSPSARTAISNFFDNLKFPLRFINNILQFKFKGAFDETLRFIANTTVGFFGISDVASNFYNIPRHDEDFGQTLGYWGIGSGPHIVWPFFGPSNLRDSIGLVADYFTTPTTYVVDDITRAGISAYSSLNDASLDSQKYDSLKTGALELYPFLRDAYEQNRLYKIKE